MEKLGAYKEFKQDVKKAGAGFGNVMLVAVIILMSAVLMVLFAMALAGGFDYTQEASSMKADIAFLKERAKQDSHDVSLAYTHIGRVHNEVTELEGKVRHLAANLSILEDAKEAKEAQEIAKEVEKPKIEDYISTRLQGRWVTTDLAPLPEPEIVYVRGKIEIGETEPMIASNDIKLAPGSKLIAVTGDGIAHVLMRGKDKEAPAAAASA